MSRKKVKENTKSIITEYFKKKDEEVDTPTLNQSMEELEIILPCKEKQNMEEREKPVFPPLQNHRKPTKPKKSKKSKVDKINNDNEIDVKHSIRVTNNDSLLK